MPPFARLALASLILLAACRPDARKKKDEIQVAQLAPATTMPNGKPSPVDSARLVTDVQQHESFQQTRSALCLRDLPDRQEVISRYPACEVLAGLEYATVRDDASRGSYMKVFELTNEGRSALGADHRDEHQGRAAYIRPPITVVEAAPSAG